MNSRFVSVVIPNMNGEKTIEKTIHFAEESLEGERFEIIVVDDFSTDRSISVLKRISEKDMRISFFENKHRIGAAFSRNIGIMNARGNVVLFLDNDVFLKEDCGSVLAKSAFSNRGISFPRIIFANGRMMCPISAGEEKYPVVSACFAIKKTALLKAGMFDSNYGTYLEDSDFFLRCRLSGIKASYEKNAVAVHAVPEFYSAERRYFLENRNLVYGMLKFRSITGKNRLPFVFPSLMKNIACGIFNFRWFDWSHYNRADSQKKKWGMLWSSHIRISVLPGIILFFIFFVGVFSGIVQYFIRKQIKFINRS